jgi:hypothetical protein
VPAVNCPLNSQGKLLCQLLAVKHREGECSFPIGETLASHFLLQDWFLYGSSYCTADFSTNLIELSKCRLYQME